MNTNCKDYFDLEDDPTNQVIQGYEISKDIRVTDDLHYILALLRRQGVVYFQQDDGPQDTFEALQIIAKQNEYFDVFTRNHEVWVIESKNFQVLY